MRAARIERACTVGDQVLDGRPLRTAGSPDCKDGVVHMHATDDHACPIGMSH